jgi:hypothetical protein
VHAQLPFILFLRGVEKLARAATRKIAMRIIRVLVISDLTVAVPAAGIRLPFSATETSVRRRFGQLSDKPRLAHVNR